MLGSPSPNESTSTSRRSKSGRQDDDDQEFDIAVLERDDGEPYGCGKWAPDFLQCCRRNPSALLAVLCVLAISSSFIQQGVIPASATQWQRRFQFKTYDLAGIRSMYDLGSLIMVLPVIYYGEFGLRRAQWIGVGGVAVGMGAVLMAIPQFTISFHYHRLNASLDLCNITREKHEDHCVHDWNVHKYTMMMGNLLVGMGTAPHYVMGVTYLDENVSHRDSAIYTAILEMCQVVGPILGFVITGQTVRIWGDSDTGSVAPAHIHDYHHHHWYGAWWLAMLLGAWASWVGAALIFPFPDELSGATVAHIRDAREALLTKRKDESFRVDPLMSDDRRMVKQLKTLLGNRVFVCTMIEECCRTAAVIGFFTFLSKFIEGAYEIDSTTANMYIGLGVVLAALLALGFGTFMQHSFRFGLVGNLRMCIIGAVAALVFSTTFFVRCPNAQIAGVTQVYQDQNQVEVGLDADCNRGCDCQTEDFDPVCFTPDITLPGDKRKNVTFFTKCFAGCFDDPFDRNRLNCSCIPPSMRPGTMKTGRCRKCHEYTFYAFLIGLAWLTMSLYMRVNPTQQILLRAVHFKQRTIALAVASACVRVLCIPAPFVVAHILDSACLVWTSLCERRPQNSCAWYSRQKLLYQFFGASVTVCAICLISLVVALLSFKNQRARRKQPNSKSPQSSGSASASLVDRPKPQLKVGVEKKSPESPIAKNQNQYIEFP